MNYFPAIDGIFHCLTQRFPAIDRMFLLFIRPSEKV